MGRTKDSIQQEVLEIVLPLSRSCVELSPGVGKTYLALKYLDILYKRTYNTSGFKSNFLVAAPRLSIFNTWKLEAQKYGLDYLIDQITFTTYRSLNDQKLSYDGIILDEIHRMTISSKKWVKSFRGFILGMTGTMPSLGSERYNMITDMMPLVYTYLIEDAVNEEILNNYEITVHLISLSDKKNLKKTLKTGRAWYTSEQAAYEYWESKINPIPDEDEDYNPPTKEEVMKLSILRMKEMQSFRGKLYYVKQLLKDYKEKTLVFCDTKDDADSVCNYSYHSTNPESKDNLDLFNKGIINNLSCVNQLSESVNIPDLERIIITHSYSNPTTTTQRLARALRLPVNKTAKIDILCYSETVDVQWVTKALTNFDQDKITWYDTDNF